MIGAVARAVRKHWLLGACIALGTAAAALGLALVMKPIYRVESVLAPVVENRGVGALGNMIGQLGGLAALAGLSPQAAQQRYESIAILRSPTFIGRFIQDNDLLAVLTPPRKSSWLRHRAPTSNDAIERFSRDIMTVKDDPKTGLVILRIEWSDPSLAASWCRGFVAAANETIRDRDIREAEQGIKYLKEELARTNQLGIQQAINHVLEEHLKVATLASVRTEYAFKIIDPGIVPDLDRPQRPKKALMMLAGLVLGAMLAMFVACVREGIFKPGAI